MIKSRTYYGEYTLERWIQLVIKRNIVLPEYQRHFVWNQTDLKRLIKSLSEGQFVQPVTIGLYKIGSNKDHINLLLDGQQRLSSILLAYLGYFPKKDQFETPKLEIAIEDDSALEEREDESNKIESIKWTISELCNKKKSLDELRTELSSDTRYETLNLGLNLKDDFWQSTFIGFSFIVPDLDVESDVQMFYTHLFRNMNYYGQKLSAYESRRSLYYQNSQLTNYFEGKTENEGNVLCELKVTQDFKQKEIDFIRYLSTLSQKKAGQQVLKGYSSYSSRENYYADYVAYLLDLEQETRPDKFNGFDFPTILPQDTIIERYTTLRNGVEKIKTYISLDQHRAFRSWIDADLWLFGLIYHVVFEGKTLSLDTEEKVKSLKNKIETIINSKTRDQAYLKRSNALGHLRSRIDESINIYKDYVS